MSRRALTVLNGGRLLPPQAPAYRYGTAAELSFINGLGSHAELVTAPRSREQLLHLYLAAMRLRVNWDGLDRFAIERHVIGLIERQAVLGGAQ